MAFSFIRPDEDQIQSAPKSCGNPSDPEDTSTLAGPPFLPIFLSFLDFLESIVLFLLLEQLHIRNSLSQFKLVMDDKAIRMMSLDENSRSPSILLTASQLISRLNSLFLYFKWNFYQPSFGQDISFHQLWAKKVNKPIGLRWPICTIFKFN